MSIAAHPSTPSTPPSFGRWQTGPFPGPASSPRIVAQSSLPWAKVLSRRYHFTIASFAYAATTCVLVIGAVNGQNNLLFWIFGLAVAGLLISGVISGWSLMGIHIHRRVLGETSAGQALEIEYTIRNTNYIFGAFGLLLEELPEGRHWLGKRFGATWPSHIAPLRTFIAHVPARTTTVVRASTLALRRGDATLGPMRVASTFPFGITRKSITFLREETILVRPQVVELAPTITIVGGTLRSESRTMARARSGDEMFALREYASGDSMRSMAWRASARLDRPVVRDPAHRRGRRVWIVLDDAVPALDEERLDRSISLTCALIELGMREGCQVGLASLSQGPLVQPGRIAPGSRGRALFDLLARFGSAVAQVPKEARASIESIPQADGLLVVSDAGAKVRADATIVNPLVPSSYRDEILPALPPPPDPALLRSGGAIKAAMERVRDFFANLRTVRGPE